MTVRPKIITITAIFAAAAVVAVVAVAAPAPAAETNTTSASPSSAAVQASFATDAKPFLQRNCVHCHNENNPTSGVRLDHLDSSLEDRHLPLWQAIRHRVQDGTMPPKGIKPTPTPQDRDQLVAWVTRALHVARLRPTPKNGLVRRLTVAQYRNTIRELLRLDDELTETLPPDAVSKDGFLNNKDTLQLSPLQLERYLEIAEEALARAIVDPAQKPAIQNFRVDLGANVNPRPFPEELILGANSLLLDNQDFQINELVPRKPFAFEPAPMRTKYRFIEGYAGNDTVRGWREYDSIYHSVFACMRGSRGYPKGHAYSTVPEGLLLRPAIPNDELFEADGTYGPKANFKISLRELPDVGRFRVTVTAGKYDDGLLLDATDRPSTSASAAAITVARADSRTVTIPAAGLYQVDAYATPRSDNYPKPDSSRLTQDLAGPWLVDAAAPAFSKPLTVTEARDAQSVPRTEAMNVGEGDFTVAAWINPSELKHAGIVALGGYNWTHGWYLDMPDGRGVLRLETAGADTQSNGTVSSPTGTLRKGIWQHVAAVVRRGAKNETVLYVNGYAVARGTVGKANLDNPRLDLHLGRMPSRAHHFAGMLEQVRIYRRALGEAELQALIEPGRQYAIAPPEKPQDLTLSLGARRFSGTLTQPAFLVLRLPAGPLALETKYSGVRGLDRVVITPLAPAAPAAARFLAFEKRAPRLGVHLGFRRDCGSTFAPVGSIQTVAGSALQRFTFESAIRNYPSPDVEKDNVNYLAGIREIAVRSEYTDGRDMPRLVVRSVEFEGPFYDSWPPASHRAIFIDFPRKQDEPAYARAIVRNFATRAYRRPVSPAEENALVAVYSKSKASGRSFRDSVKDALQVALTSPQFLFLTETSTSPQPEPLTGHELASKLSYFLWNAPPDRQTLNLASAGALRGNLPAEVARLMADARFSQFAREFAYQWLALDKFHVLEPDRARYPKLTRDVRAQLREEPIQFLEYLFRQNLPVRNLIDSDFVVANEVVASYYDLPVKPDTGFRFVPIPRAPGRKELGGVLTQPAILAGLSDGRESNPVKRGAWLARRIVAEPPDDPPPNVPALGEEDAGKLTLRQRIERHRSQPGCVQCHLKIDPWGIAFEEFDAGGRLKKEPADARSKLPDQFEVAGMQDLKRHLAVDRVDQVAFSVLKHLAVYASGRNLSYNETDFLKKDALKLRACGYRMKDMVEYIVTSRMFLEK